MHSISLANPPDFLRQLESKKIVLIGNGPSAIAGNYGQTIDGFDRIVRINNFVTQGLETKVGSRTDIWVNGANQGLKTRSAPPENILVMIPPVVLKHKGTAIQARIQHRLGTAEYYMLPLATMQELENTSRIERPTTGFFAIYFFYLLGVDLTLHGFDFFQGSTSHYFDSPVKRWLKDKGLIRKAGKHNLSAEQSFVEQLIQTGAIKLLRS